MGKARKVAISRSPKLTKLRKPQFDLPPELFRKVVGYLCQTDRLCCTRVCRLWKEMIYADLATWETFVIRDSARKTLQQAEFYKLQLQGSVKGVRHLVLPETCSGRPLAAIIKNPLFANVPAFTLHCTQTVLENLWRDHAAQIQSANITILPFRSKGVVYLDVESMLAAASQLQSLKINSNTRAVVNSASQPSSRTFEIVHLSIEGGPWHRDNNFSYDHPSDSYPRLQSLSLESGNHSRLILSVAGSTTLRKLRLHNVPITETFHFPNLQELLVCYYQSTQSVTAQIPSSLREPMPHLHTVKLYRVDFTSNQLANLKSGSPLLTTLELSSINGVGVQEITNAIPNWPCLQVFALTQMYSIGKQLIQTLTNHTPHLTQLSLGRFAESVGTELLELVQTRLERKAQHPESEQKTIQQLRLEYAMLEDRATLQEIKQLVPKLSGSLIGMQDGIDVYREL